MAGVSQGGPPFPDGPPRSPPGLLPAGLPTGRAAAEQRNPLLPLNNQWSVSSSRADNPFPNVAAALRGTTPPVQRAPRRSSVKPTVLKQHCRMAHPAEHPGTRVTVDVDPAFPNFALLTYSTVQDGKGRLCHRLAADSNFVDNDAIQELFRKDELVCAETGNNDWLRLVSDFQKNGPEAAWHVYAKVLDGAKETCGKPFSGKNNVCVHMPLSMAALDPESVQGKPERDGTKQSGEKNGKSFGQEAASSSSSFSSSSVSSSNKNDNKTGEVNDNNSFVEWNVYRLQFGPHNNPNKDGTPQSLPLVDKPEIPGSFGDPSPAGDPSQASPNGSTTDDIYVRIVQCIFEAIWKTTRSYLHASSFINVAEFGTLRTLFLELHKESPLYNSFLPTTVDAHDLVAQFCVAKCLENGKQTQVVRLNDLHYVLQYLADPVQGFTQADPNGPGFVLASNVPRLSLDQNGTIRQTWQQFFNPPPMQNQFGQQGAFPQHLSQNGGWNAFANYPFGGMQPQPPLFQSTGGPMPPHFGGHPSVSQSNGGAQQNVGGVQPPSLHPHPPLTLPVPAVSQAVPPVPLQNDTVLAPSQMNGVTDALHAFKATLEEDREDNRQVTAAILKLVTKTSDAASKTSVLLNEASATQANDVAAVNSKELSFNRKPLKLVDDGLFVLKTWERIEEWKLSWSYWKRIVQDSFPEHDGSFPYGGARATALVTRFIDPDLLKNEIVPFVGGFNAWHELSWETAVSKTYEVHVGSIVQRLLKKVTELVHIGENDGTNQDNVLKIEQLQAAVVQLSEAFRKPFDVPKTRVRAQEHYERLARDWRDEPEDVRYSRLQDEFYRVFSEKLVLADQLEHEKSFWTNTFWGTVMLARSSQTPMSNVLSSIENEAINRPESLYESLYGKNVRKHLLVQNHVEQTGQEATRRLAEKTLSIQQRGRSPAPAERVWCEPCKRVHTKGPLVNDPKFPKRMTTCWGPNREWGNASSSRSTSRQSKGRGKGNGKGNRERKSGFRQSFKRTPNKRREKTRKAALMAAFQDLLGSDAESVANEEEQDENYTSAHEDTPFAAAVTNLSRSISDFHTNEEFGHETSQSNDVSFARVVRSKATPNERGRSRSVKRQQVRQRLTHSVYHSRSRSPNKAKEYEHVDAQMRTLVDEAIAVPDIVTKTLDGILHELSCEARPDLFEEHEHADKHSVKRSYDIAVASLATEQALSSVAVKTEKRRVLIDSGATNHNTNALDRVRVNHKTTIPVLTANDTVDGDLQATLVDLHDAVPAVCYNADGTKAVPPVIRAKRCLFSSSFPEEILSTRRLQSNGHAVEHPELPKSSFVKWNVKDGLERWSPLKYDNGYYLDVVVTVLQQEQVRKITQDVDAVAKDLVLHRRLGHATPIPLGCGACDSVVKRKPHKKGGSEKRISSTVPGETWAYDVANIPLSLHGNLYCHAFRDINRKSKLVHVSFSQKKDRFATSQAYTNLGDTFPMLRKLMRTLVSDKDKAFDSTDAKSVFRTTFPLARFQCCPPHEQQEHGWQEATVAVLKRHGQILLNDANLPASFLAYAMKHAAVTLNTLRADPDNEVWPEQHRLSFNRLRPFGCKVRYIADVQKEYQRSRKDEGTSRGTTLQRLRSGREGVMLGYENVRSVLILDVLDFKNGKKYNAVREVAMSNVHFDELTNSEGTDVREVNHPRQELPDAEFHRAVDRTLQRNRDKIPNLARYRAAETVEDAENRVQEEEQDDLLVEFPEEIEILPTEDEEDDPSEFDTSAETEAQEPQRRGPGRPRKKSARPAKTRRVREKSVGVLPEETSSRRSAARREASAKIRSNVPVVSYIAVIRRLITILSTFLLLAATSVENASSFIDRELGNATRTDRRSILEASARRHGVFEESVLPSTTAGPYAKIPFRRRRQRTYSGPDVRATKYAKIRSVVEANIGEDGLPVQSSLERRDNRFLDPAAAEYVRAAKQEHPSLSMRSIKEDATWNDSVRREQDVIAKAGRWVWRKDLPVGTTTLRAQYVLKVKRDGRKKTRIVACGNQQERSNGETNYSPATSGSIVRSLIAVSQLLPHAVLGTLDAKEAFMQATLRQKIAITLPNDWRHDLSPISVNGTVYNPNDTSVRPPVLQLTRSIYGLRAAPREWLNHVNNGLRIRGSVKSGSDGTTFALYDENNNRFVDLARSTRLKTGVYTLRKKVRFSVPEARFYPAEASPFQATPVQEVVKQINSPSGVVSGSFTVPTDPQGQTVYEEYDPTVVAGTPLAIITVYVDDILIVAPNNESFLKAVALIGSIAKCTTPEVVAEPAREGTVSAVDFLGISHVRSKTRDIHASVDECRRKLVAFNTEPYASVPCPARVVAFSGEDNLLGTANVFKPSEKQPSWRTAVGTLQYLADVLWVNIKYPSWQLGKVSSSPRETNRRAFEQAIGYVQQHVATLVYPSLYAISANVTDEERQIAREATSRWYDYVGLDLSGTKNAAIDFASCGYGVKPRPVQLRVFSDSDWSGEADGKSTSAFLITLDKDVSTMPRVKLDQQQCKLYLDPVPAQALTKENNRGSLISWSSRRQNGLPALSSAEAELHALVSACKQALHIQQFLLETRPLHGRDVLPFVVHGDNQAANTLVHRSNVSRTRHMSLRVSWSRALFETGLSFVSHIGAKDNPADVLTKPCTSSDYNSRFETVNLFVKRVSDPPKRRKETTPEAVARVLDWSSTNLRATVGFGRNQSASEPFVKSERKKSRPQRREERLGFVAV